MGGQKSGMQFDPFHMVRRRADAGSGLRGFLVGHVVRRKFPRWSVMRIELMETGGRSRRIST